MLMKDAATGRSLFYAPGLGEMEPHVWEAMQNADVVLVEAPDPISAVRQIAPAVAGWKRGRKSFVRERPRLLKPET